MKIPNIMKVFMYDACINFQIWIYEAYWGKNRPDYFCGPELVMDGWEDREYTGTDRDDKNKDRKIDN